MDGVFTTAPIPVRRLAPISRTGDTTVPDASPARSAADRNLLFGILALPNFPEGIDSAPPGPFSLLLDHGRLGSRYHTVLGFDAWHPETNFHDQSSPLVNQNGIVFFPGGVGLYKDVKGSGQRALVGGLGVSGDGVDQDDVVTSAAANGYTPNNVLRADQVFFAGIRLPYQKFDRNPEG